MSDEKNTAEKIWASVLESMSKDLHNRYALVEARKRLIGQNNADQIAVYIEELAIEAFGQDQVSEPTHQIPKLRPTPPNAKSEDIEDVVVNTVSSAFEGTLDGSMEQARSLYAIAIEMADDLIKRQKNLGWFEKRRLRSLAKKTATDEMRIALEPPGEACSADGK